MSSYLSLKIGRLKHYFKRIAGFITNRDKDSTPERSKLDLQLGERDAYVVASLEQTGARLQGVLRDGQQFIYTGASIEDE